MKYIICKQTVFGGTNQLLDRLKNWLSKKNFEVYEYCDGNDFSSLPSTIDLAIIPSSSIGDLYRLKKNNIIVKRFVIWILGSGSLMDSYYNERNKHILNKLFKWFLIKESNDMLQCLCRNDSIIFTDIVGMYNTFKYNSCKYMEYIKKDDKIIFPVAVKTNNISTKMQLSLNLDNHENNVVRIAWIGRVSSDFKEISIKRMIYDIDRWMQINKRRIILTIVGDGDAFERVRIYANKFNINIKFIHYIDYNSLENYIVHNVDLLIAMGTSALDGARCGCPTIIITAAREDEFDKVYYRWIFESVGYSLGEFPGLDVATNQIRKDFFSIMKEFDYRKCSIKSQEYSNSFDENIVFENILNRDLPNLIDDFTWTKIRNFYYIKRIKNIIKSILGHK